MTNLLRVSDFVKVKAGHNDPSRAGKDGQVVGVDRDDITLIFGCDRFNRDQGCRCYGAEHWNIDELDLDSVDPSPIR